MKPPSGFLWQLIHALDSNEKRFFKRNYLQQQKEVSRIYLQLFNNILAQKKYDEDAILKKCAPLITPTNISSQKHYLLNILGKALIELDGRDNPGQEIYNQIMLIRVFRKKGLLEEALTVWKKAMLKARQSESFALLNLLKTEFEKIILLSSVNTRYDELHSIFKSHIITNKEYAELITFRDAYTEALLLKRKAHFDLDDETREKVSGLLDQVARSGASIRSDSFWLCHYYNMTRATLQYLLNETGAALKIFRQLLKDWVSHPGYIESHGEYYIELLYMINYSGIQSGAYRYVEETFNDPINDLITDSTQRANYEAIKYLALVRVYNKTARFGDVIKLLQSTKTKYRQWEPLLNSDLNRTMNISIGIASFVIEQYQDALFFIKRSVSYFRDGTREEHAAISHILLLLITYTINNPRLFDAQYKSTYTFFYRRKKKNIFETAFIQCMNRTFYMTGTREKTVEFKKTLEIFRKNEEDSLQQIAMNIFNFSGWLQSQIQGISYRQFVEKKVGNTG